MDVYTGWFCKRRMMKQHDSDTATTKKLCFSFTQLSQKCSNSSMVSVALEVLKLKHSQILMLKILFPSSSCDHFFQKSTFFQISSRVTLSMSTTQPYFPLVHKYISVIKPLSMVSRFGKVLHFPCQLQVRDKSHSADSILL